MLNRRVNKAQAVQDAPAQLQIHSDSGAVTHPNTALLPTSSWTWHKLPAILIWTERLKYCYCNPNTINEITY